MPCDMEAYERQIMAIRIERMSETMNAYYDDCLDKIMASMGVPADLLEGGGGTYSRLYTLLEQFKQNLGIK